MNDKDKVDEAGSSTLCYYNYAWTPPKRIDAPPLGRIYLNTPNPLNIASLTDQQRIALKRILETDNVFVLRSNILEMAGLPRFRTEARRILIGI